MKRYLNLLLILALVSFWGVSISNAADKKDPVDYVDPFIGTDFFGHTFPGASVPNALVHLSPDVHTEGWTFCAGYIYSENTIIGFSHTHWSGVGMVNGGEVMLMPHVGDRLQVVPGTRENPDAGYRSRFDHADETASPGYYSVKLKDYDVNVELTSTQRAGFHRYTFPKANNARVILDLGHQIGDMSSGGTSNLKIVDNYRVESAKNAGLGNVFFVAEFSKPFKYYGTFDASYVTPESGGSLFPYKNAEKGTKIGAFLNVMNTEYVDELQKIAIEDSPQGIPLIFSRDVIHGFKTIFPIPLGLAASWDTEIARSAARISAIEATSVGVRWTFAPMLDIAQDSRWGRIAESPGEDPYLASLLARAYVKGFQGEDPSDPTSMAACAKHFIGYGAVIGGRDYNTALIDEATLRNIYLPPFLAASRPAYLSRGLALLPPSNL